MVMAGARAEFRLIVGLGNVGTRYAGTRHNAGFQYVDGLAARFGEAFREDRRALGALARIQANGHDFRLLKPSTLMNRSGDAVVAVAGFHRIPPVSILVAHDELDLPAGTVRVKLDGGHGGHNGLRDIDAKLGSRDYWRLRIGVGRPGAGEDAVAHVLTRPSPDQRAAIDEAIGRALDESERLLIDGDMEAVMHSLHSSRPQD